MRDSALVQDSAVVPVARGARGGHGQRRVARAPQGPPPAPREARPQQGQPPATRTPLGRLWPSGRAAFPASVVVAGSGQPARKARVSLSGGNEVGGGRSTTTDDSGRFAFSALPEGRFNLSASKPGHITGTYGQRQPGRPGTPIQLADGQRLQVQLQITRGGVITGTVLDEHTEAHSRHARARAALRHAERPAHAATGRKRVDRRPRRLSHLRSPARRVHRLCDAAEHQSRRRDGRQAELQQLVQQSEVMARLEAVRRRRPSPSVSRSCERRCRRERRTRRRAGYAPVYYPGTTSPSSAATVTSAPVKRRAASTSSIRSCRSRASTAS